MPTRAGYLSALALALLAVLPCGFAVGVRALSQTPGVSSATPPIDVTKLGPQVGQLVPDFSLRDQHGRQWTRASIMGPKGAMLVFFRSADW